MHVAQMYDIDIEIRIYNTINNIWHLKIRSGHFTKNQNRTTLINELNNADKGIYMGVKHKLFIPKNRVILMNNFKNPTININF